MKPSPILMVAFAGALFAGAARAQTHTPSLFDLHLAPASHAPVAAAPVARPAGVAAKATPDLADPLDPLARPKLVAGSLDSEVFATTAVDRKFGKRDDLTGSLGLLCGRQPEHTESGGAAAYGSDPHGRFVGAKLSLAF
ncbi:hypothetical protein [Phenylobacterium sp.]|uniref:hypothetical protein n=1 Tax=Phenylobacterium sp. TaxID=1871053 RepID=UPI002C07829C|nr:hypothetical protein [Phenylobacterium sp.]HLZ76904.1 hypothetical protein [Phenylobacterium sp.]